jgi:LytS/YehU family sensor histidine kinase
LYIELEQLRFENHFNFNIEVDESVETERVQVPPLLLQPYVENAIWHGLMHKDDQGNIEIIIEMKNNQLFMTITDDGVGREKSALFKSKYDNNNKSLGMSITKDRIILLNKIYQNKARIDVIDLYDKNNNSAGTRIEISVPVVKSNL